MFQINPLGCGVAPNTRKGKLVGGFEVQPDIYPWMAALRLRKMVFYCGAFVISSKHVLTAAHCVHNIEPNHLQVYFGGHNISEDYTSIRRVKKIIEHQNYNPVSFDNDIAILSLYKALPFSSTIQPICLPSKRFEDYSGKNVIVAGWGKTGEDQPYSKVLQSIVVPVWSEQQCAKSEYGTDPVTDHMICAGYPKGSIDSCGVSGFYIYFLLINF